MTKGNFPEYGCCCDLDPGEPLDDCVINVGHWGDCTHGATSFTKTGQPRIRKSPRTCRFWVKASTYNAGEPQ